ncbi:uncharacterized protein Smp_202930 [Schistosoma mansoni]|nr:uncharacterized protein Smp_202930 [Schistosoma mansoni]|eukprot:XP_018652915.1 uncharacterized protein Smp_202930 [Schistosoma mansoni]
MGTFQEKLLHLNLYNIMRTLSQSVNQSLTHSLTNQLTNSFIHLLRPIHI